MSNLYDQLMQLRAMTIRTGSIHDAQILQLRNYPLLVDGVVKATTRFDFERKIVEYKATKVKPGFGTPKGPMLADMANLKRCVQTLMWPDTIVVFKLGKRVIYDSRA